MDPQKIKPNSNTDYKYEDYICQIMKKQEDVAMRYSYDVRT